LSLVSFGAPINIFVTRDQKLPARRASAASAAYEQRDAAKKSQSLARRVVLRSERSNYYRAVE
jgi:hypothetical protein